MKLNELDIPALIELRDKITNDPKNKISNSIYLYSKSARKKMDVIDREITDRLAVKRKAAGNPVHCDGYSGRQSNKR